MADFFQNGSITTLHKLHNRPIDEMEAELKSFADERPMALILPSLFSELEGPALPKIVEELKQATYISDIIVGLDQADKGQFEHAKAFFSGLPQNLHILWNDGPRLRELDKLLAAQNLAPTEMGKGRNVWYCMGYVLAAERAEAVALHDCDILTYRNCLLSRLLYPIADPSSGFSFSKGYYARVAEGGRLSGRVTRLFVTPMLRALKKIFGPMDYLEYLDSFRYPLSGEFAMSKDLLENIRIPSDWGLEIGVLSEVYRNSSPNHICQVDIADNYDHKHQPLSQENTDTGLSKMSTDIAKSIYRKLATEGVTLNSEIFRTIKASYFRIALDTLEQYAYDAKINGLIFDRHGEEQAIEVYIQSIISAGETFLSNPMKTPFIPNWNRVFAAIPDFAERLRTAVMLDNAPTSVDEAIHAAEVVQSEGN